MYSEIGLDEIWSERQKNQKKGQNIDGHNNKTQNIDLLKFIKQI